MIGALAGAAIGAALKAGYDRYNQTHAEGEKRQYSDRMNAESWNYYVKQQKFGPSLQREGLEAAGYNPMLALNNGSALSMPSMSGSSASSGPSSSLGDVIGSAKSGAALGQAIETMFEEDEKQKKEKTKQMQVETKLLEQELQNKKAVESKTKSSTVRDYTGITGDVLGDVTDAAILYDLMKDKNSPNGKGGTPSVFKQKQGAKGKILNTMMPLFLGGSKLLAPALIGGTMLAPVITSSAYEKGSSHQGKGYNKYYPNGNWFR